jgi:hypothetical protein
MSIFGYIDDKLSRCVYKLFPKSKPVPIDMASEVPHMAQPAVETATIEGPIGYQGSVGYQGVQGYTGVQGYMPSYLGGNQEAYSDEIGSQGYTTTYTTSTYSIGSLQPGLPAIFVDKPASPQQGNLWINDGELFMYNGEEWVSVNELKKKKQIVKPIQVGDQTPRDLDI